MMANADRGLERGIGRYALAALVANVVIGAGILGLPGRIYALVGGWSIVLVALAALLVAAFALCFAELASRYDRTGGPYLYVREAFGPIPGFTAGWLLWLSRVLTIATQLNLLAEYGASLWPALGTEGAIRPAFLCGVTGLLTLLTLSGVAPSARLSGVVTVVKLGLLFALVALCLPAADLSRLTPGPAPELTGFSDGVLLMLFAFFGFEVVTVVAGETRDPRREMPRGLLVGLVIIATTYALVIAATIGVLPDPATKERAILVAASAVGGQAGGALALGAAFAVLIGALASAFLLAPRLLFALAEGEQVPRVFGRVAERRRTPDVAILTTAGAALLLAVFNSFVTVLVLATAVRLLVYIACCLALIRLRRTGPPAQFTAPFGPVLALGGAGIGVLILAASARQELLTTVVAALAGFVLLGLARLGKSRAAG